MLQQQADLKLFGFGKVFNVKARLNSTLLDVVRQVNSTWIRQDLIVKNIFNAQQLKLNQSVDTILMSEEGLRMISIKANDGKKIGPLTNPKYEQNQDDMMKYVLYALLNEQHGELKEFCRKREISEQAYVLGTRILKKMCQKKKKGESLSTKEIEKLTSQLKDSKVKIERYTKNLNESNQKIKKLEQEIKKQNQASHNSQLAKKIKEVEDQNSAIIRQKQALIKSRVFSSIQVPILFKSKIFESQYFKDKLNQLSSSLEKFINSFCSNKIKQVKSKFFTSIQSPEPFVQKLKVNKKFIWLFEAKGKLFGIYSSNTYGTKVIKSYDGFFFTLSPTPKMYKLRQKKFIWKHSSSQINILNQSLTMNDTKNNLVMKKKDKLFNNIEIAQAEEHSLFGGHNDILIEGFECLTIQFQDDDELDLLGVSQKL